MEHASEDRVRDLFLTVCDLGPAEREELLRLECEGDPALREELDELLAGDRAADGVGGTGRFVAGVAATIAAGPAVGGAVETIAGYRIVRPLGSGGAGSVYEARQESLDRAVALKILSPVAALSRRAQQRFEREAWIAGRLNHPGIVKVFERGAWQGCTFLTMELVDGGALADVIERLRAEGADERLGLETGSRPHVEWAVRRIAEVARALHYAHERGVVHRDVKPSNLLVDLDSRSLKLADFGIAIDSKASRQTTDGQAVGTLWYMAPEQLRGERDHIDRRADVFALGVTLFELVTLKLPYRGSTVERYMADVLQGTPRRLRTLAGHVSRDLEIVISTAIAREAGDRYQSAADFADDLERLLALRPIRARPPGRVERVAKWVRRRPAHAALVAVLGLGIPTIAALGWVASERSSRLLEGRIDDLYSEIHRVDRSDPQRTIDLANEILALDSGRARAYVIRASGWYNLASAARTPDERAARLGAALDDLGSAIAIDPDTAYVRRFRARVYAAMGRGEEARAESARADALPGGDRMDLVMRAWLAGQEGNWDEAERLYTRSLVQQEQTDAHEGRAYARQRLGNLDGAIEDYRVMIALQPKDPYPRRALSKLLVKTAKRSDSPPDRFPEALAQLDRAAELAPDDAEAFEIRSFLFLEWGKSDAAAGNVAAARERLQSAEGAARSALELDGALLSSHLDLGAALVEQARLGDEDPALLQQAIEHYEIVIDRALVLPDATLAGEAAASLCDALLQARELDAAGPACRRAVEIQPDSALAHYNLAAFQALTGSPDAAIAELERDWALGDRDHAWLASDAMFDGLHADPRFHDILRRMRSDR